MSGERKSEVVESTLEALERCQRVLAMLLKPADKDSTFHTATAWAQCFEAEVKARKALERTEAEVTTAIISSRS